MAPPRQLPAAPHRFVGRDAELAALTALFGERPRAGRVLVVSGMAGAGKTWLALHWAHRTLGAFPDGHLHADLRGFAPSGRPATTRTAIRGLLHALGVPPAAVPFPLDACVGLYRSLLAGRRTLVLLDNARDAAQVAPLLPGGPHCTVLVTARARLTGLVTGHGARCVTLDTLPDDDARRMLAARIGPARTDAEPQALASLIGSCAGLPLALGVTAARAAQDPDRPLAALADELRDPATRLDALGAGDAAADVRTALRSSYDALTPAAASALGVLARAPGPDIGLRTAAHLLGRSATAALVTLRDLEHACLLRQPAPGRYRMHDLVRLYAAERSAGS